MCMGSFGSLRAPAFLVPISVCIGRQKGMDPDRFTSLRASCSCIFLVRSVKLDIFYTLIITVIFYYNNLFYPESFQQTFHQYYHRTTKDTLTSV